MSPFSWFVFAVRFALTDTLGRRSARWVTGVNALVVASVVAAAVASLGLWAGTKQRQLDGYRRTGSASVVARKPGRGVGFAPAEVDDLVAALGKAVPAARPGLVAAPHVLLGQEWRVKGGGRPEFARGRTFAAGDPVLKSPEDDDWVRRPADDAPPGIIAGPGLLRALDLPADAGPPSLEARAGVEYAEIPVAGVLRSAPPGGKDYLLAESAWEELRARSAPARAVEIASGPMPAAWAAGEPPGDVAEYLRHNELRWLGTRKTINGRFLMLRWAGGAAPAAAAPTLQQWQVHLENVAKRLRATRPEKADGFDTPAGVDVIPAPPQPRAYDRVTLYLDDPALMKPVAKALRAAGLETEDDRSEQYEKILKTAGRVEEMVTWLVVGLLAVGAAVLFTVQNLTASAKSAELGMLKAMGLPGRVLALVSALEAAVIWGIGFALGAAGGTAAGAWVESRLAGDRGSGPAFAVPVWTWAVIAAGSLAACVATTWLATYRARNRSPMATLGDR